MDAWLDTQQCKSEKFFDGLVDTEILLIETELRWFECSRIASDPICLSLLALTEAGDNHAYLKNMHDETLLIILEKVRNTSVGCIKLGQHSSCPLSSND
jgi:hypothetical protein